MKIILIVLSAILLNQPLNSHATPLDSDPRNYEEVFRNAYYDGSITELQKEYQACQTNRCAGLGQYYIAAYYQTIGSYDSSLTYAGKSFVKLRQTNDLESIKNLYWLSGIILKSADNNKSAIGMLEKALELSTSKKEEMLISLDLAKSLYLTERLLDAKKLLDKTKEYFDGKNPNKYADSHLILGKVESEYQLHQPEPDYNEAYHHLFETLKSYNKDELRAQGFSSIGVLLLRDNKFGEAKNFLDSAMLLQTDTAMIQGILINYAALNKKNGKLEAAARDYRKAIDINDDITLESIEGYTQLSIHAFSNWDTTAYKNLMLEYQARVSHKLEVLKELEGKNLFVQYNAAQLEEHVADLKRERMIFKVGASVIALLLILIAYLVFKSRIKPLLTKEKEFEVLNGHFNVLKGQIRYFDKKIFGIDEKHDRKDPKEEDD